MTKRTAFIFPGQGSQYLGMGKELLKEFSEAKDMMERASQVFNFDLKKLCINGPEKELNDTRNTQPAIYTISMIINELLQRNGIEPVMVAGHSLGEYSALAVAKAFTFEDGLRLVRKRGILMNEALPVGLGSMAAIIGLGKNKISEICSEVENVCEIANYNSPQQIVISGKKSAIKRAVKLAENKGAKKAIELDVSGPFHSSLMSPAQEKLEKVIIEIEIDDPIIPVVANATANYVTSSQEIKNALLAQLTSSVRWVESMELMINEGINTFIEVGPGKVLKGLMRRIDRSVQVYNVDDPASFDKLLSVGTF